MNEWPGLNDLKIKRRWPLPLALLGFALYFGSVVAGSMLQGALPVSWAFGWLQQVVSALVTLGFAMALGSPQKLLGIRNPPKNWLLVAVAIGLSVTAAGLVADWLIKSPTEHPGAEYFFYQATAPGIGEELGFRGLFLGLLATAGLQRGWANAGGFWLLLIAAIPFSLLHLLEVSGFPAVVIFFYTLYAGIAFGWVRMATGSLWPAIVAHNIANVCSGLVTVWMNHLKN